MWTRTGAIELAETGEWMALQVLVEMDFKHAMERDRFGMLPIHWVCTEMDVPYQVIECLLKAYPEGSRVKNNSQMLPLHVALRTGLPTLHIRLLLEAFPAATLEENDVGETPIKVAQINSANYEKLEMLRSVRASVLAGDISLYNSTSSSDEIIDEERRKKDMYHPPKNTPTNDCLSELPDLVNQFRELKVTMEKSNQIFDHLLQRRSTSYKDGLRHGYTYSNQTQEPAYMPRRDEIEVVWSKGELGICLSRISDSYGAKVTRVSHKAHAIGIKDIHVGYFLIYVNKECVVDWKFSTIVKHLKGLHRPISLKFTSRDPQSHSTDSSSSVRKLSVDTVSTECSGDLSPVDRQSVISVLPEDIQTWCDEQSTMHSRLFILLSETLSRCESLEQNYREQTHDPFCNLKDLISSNEHPTD